MVAYTTRMPVGIPGNISRNAGAATVEPGNLDSSNKPAYGAPVKISSGLIRSIAASDAASVIYGFLARPFPAQGGSTDISLGAATPPNGTCDVLKRGYINVLVRAGIAAKGGVVYTRVANATTSQPIGGIEAASDSTNTVVVPGAYFTGGADASGNAEIFFVSPAA